MPIIEAIYEKLGGRRVLRADVTSEADLARVVAQRIPLRALVGFRNSGFSEAEIGYFIIPARTRRHRQRRREPLNVEESDRLGRLTRGQAPAGDVFGDPEKAKPALRGGLGIFNGEAPPEVAPTER